MADQGKHDNTSAADGFRPMGDIVLVLTFLTRLPLPCSTASGRTLAQASWAFPLAGVIVGGVGGGVYFTMALIGAHDLISVTLGLVATALVSGALHEDGLADVADGFGGGATKEKKLEIMHDSRIGTYGVLALLFSVGIRVATLATIAATTNLEITFIVFVAIGAFSRGLLPSVMAGLPNARDGGLSKGAGRPGFGRILLAFVLGVAGTIALFNIHDASVLAAIGATVVTVGFFCLVAKRQIGGQTGDVIGAAQQIGEVTFLVVLSIMLKGAL